MYEAIKIAPPPSAATAATAANEHKNMSSKFNWKIKPVNCIDVCTILNGLATNARSLHTWKKNNRKKEKKQKQVEELVVAVAYTLHSTRDEKSTRKLTLVCISQVRRETRQHGTQRTPNTHTCVWEEKMDEKITSIFYDASRTRGFK